MVSPHQAALACGRQSDARTHPRRTVYAEFPKFNFMGACALPYYDKRTDKVERGISCAGCQVAIEKSALDTDGTEWIFDARDTAYDQDGFLDHFRWCEQAQLLWRSSCEGKKQPPELPQSARLGGYLRRR